MERVEVEVNFSGRVLDYLSMGLVEDSYDASTASDKLVIGKGEKVNPLTEVA